MTQIDEPTNFNSRLDEFLRAKLVVTPKMVYTEDNISYVTLADYPTMVTELNNLISDQIEDAYKRGWSGGWRLGGTR